jgi:hypothetical protein
VLKEQRGRGRVRLRGLSKVGGEIARACTASNLTRWWRQTARAWRWRESRLASQPCAVGDLKQNHDVNRSNNILALSPLSCHTDSAGAGWPGKASPAHH